MQIVLNFEKNASRTEIAAELRNYAAIFDSCNQPVKSEDKVEEKAFKEKAPVAVEQELSLDRDNEAGIEDDSLLEDHEDEEEVEAEKPKATKKITLDDVNDACKALAMKIGGKTGREHVLALLKKKFKTTSVSELKSEQYNDVLEAMKV